MIHAAQSQARAATPVADPDAIIPDVQSAAGVSRRAILGGAGALVLALSLRNPAFAADPQKFGADGMPNGWRDDPTVFVTIAPDGSVTVTNHRSEMGQGVRTSVALVVADELEADWARVRVVQAPGDEARYGNQDTDGSRSLRHFFPHFRHVGAAARLMLIQAGAKQWNVPEAEIRAENHRVTHAASGRSAGYGDLATAAAALPVPARERVVLKKPEAFRYIGKGNVGLVDNADITTGKAVYGLDHKMDGMLYAVVARPPVFGGKVQTVDDAEALKVPGVVKIFTIEAPGIPSEFMPLGGVAVVAKNTWAALKAREALKITWDDGPNANYDTTFSGPSWRRRSGRPGRSCATRATSMVPWRRRKRGSRPSTLSRIWRRPRWSRPQPWRR